MNRRRLALGAAGAALVGAVFVAGDRVGATVPAADAVSLLGNDYLLVVALAVVSAFLAAVVVERGDGVDQFRMPDAEGAVSVPAPGDDLAAALDRRVLLPVVSRDDRRAVRERLREDAVDALRRTENCTAAEARRRVASGRWTSDAEAAAFLSAERRLPPVGGALRAALRGEPWFSRGARRTADEIARRAASGPGGRTSLEGDVA